VGPRAVLDAVVRKIPSRRREENPRTPIVQPVAQCYHGCGVGQDHSIIKTTTDPSKIWKVGTNGSGRNQKQIKLNEFS
jgi:hypothetical protein